MATSITRISQSFVLIPCEKPNEPAARSVIWPNGAIAYVGEDGTLWLATEDHARKLIDISGQDREHPPKIRDAVLVPSLETLFIIVEGFSGVYACHRDSTLCLPLTCGRLRSGLRTAQPIKTEGPQMTCLHVANGLLYAGDAWGAVVVWTLEHGSIASKPVAAFGAHGKSGCASVRSVPDRPGLIVTTGGEDNEIKVFELHSQYEYERIEIELQEETYHVECVASLVLTRPQSRLSTPVTSLDRLQENNDIILCAGLDDGSLVLWQVDLKKDGDARIQYDVSYLDAYANEAQSSVVFVEFVGRRLVTCSESGETIVFHFTAGLERIEIEYLVALFNPIIGVFHSYVVIDEFTAVPLDQLQDLAKATTPQRNAQHRILDVKKAIQYLMHTTAANAVATKKAFNRPLHDYRTFGNDLLPIVPNRRCCRVGGGPSTEAQIWVKRRVRPPKVDVNKRKPLFESNRTAMTADGQVISQQTKLPEKPLPPFCTYRHIRATEPSEYLTEKRGELYCSVVTDES